MFDDKKYYLFIRIKEETNVEYTQELKAELDKRYEGYKSGKTKMITPTESRRRINKILKAKFSK